MNIMTLDALLHGSMRETFQHLGSIWIALTMATEAFSKEEGIH